MDRYDEEMFDELAMDGPEGAADSYDEYDEAEGYDAGDAAEGYDEGDEADGFEAMDEDDGYEDEGDESDDDLDQALAFALGAEDSDEFFRRLAQGLTRGARAVGRAAARAAPVVGQVARAVAPVASMIPGYGTAIGGVANVLGQLLADEASEDEALDAFAELAVHNRRAVPVAAALATRTVLGPRAAQLPAAARRQAVRTVRRAANTLVQQGGPAAIRALAPAARSVRRTAVARRTPVQVRPRVLANTARRIARQGGGMQSNLTRPLPAGRQVLRRVGAAVRAGAPPARALTGSGYGLARGYGGGLGLQGPGRTLVIRGPVTIRIRGQ